MRRGALALVLALQLSSLPPAAASSEPDFLLAAIGRCLAVFELTSLAIEGLNEEGGNAAGASSEAIAILKRSFARLAVRGDRLADDLHPQVLAAFTAATDELRSVVTGDLTGDFLKLANQCNLAFGLLDSDQPISPPT